MDRDPRQDRQLDVADVAVHLARADELGREHELQQHHETEEAGEHAVTKTGLVVHSTAGIDGAFFTRSGTIGEPLVRFASCPHAASMSSPRGVRKYVGKPSRLHSAWNASITAAAGRAYGASGCGFHGIKLTLHFMPRSSFASWPASR